MGVARLGRYTILKHLASGGMADVLLARTEGIEGWQRHVVVKRIRAEHAKDARFIRMFLDEARVAASLHHQHIVTVHDIGDDDGAYFFSMEYLHGEDLRKILSQVSRSGMHLPLAHAISIVSAIAAGLHYAHERRGADGKALEIVHRDVSPSNVLVGYDGSVKIVDFGIAKAALRDGEETRTGSLKGKVAYMSPEQCQGEAVDRRSDVFALGVVLFELATTTRLYKDENEFRAMENIVHGEVPDPRGRRPGLPVELAAIIMHALAKGPADRFQTADELRLALDQLAVKARYTTSPSALATFMVKLFGGRPEPWLEDSRAPLPLPPPMELEIEAVTPSPHAGWMQPPPAVRAPVVPDSEPGAKGTKAGKRRLPRGTGSPGAISDPPAPPAEPQPIPPNETAPSEKFGFEQRIRPPAAPGRRALASAALIGLPMLALGGAIAWWLVPRTPAPAHAAVAAAITPRPTAPEAPPVPAKIDVQIEADAANARVVFRRHLTPLPLTTQIAPNDIVELVEVSAPGHRTERYWLTFDRTTHLRAHLAHGHGIEEASEAQTLVALGEAAAAPAADEADEAAAPDEPARAGASAVPHHRRIGRAALPETTVVLEHRETAARVSAVADLAAVSPPVVPTAEAPPPLPAPSPAVAPAPSPGPARAPAAGPRERSRTIAPTALAGLLVSSTHVVVPDVVQMEMMHDGKKQTSAVLKVCVGAGGAVTASSLLRSSGYPAYDAQLVAGVRGWRYRPLRVGGRAVAACSAVVIAYALP